MPFVAIDSLEGRSVEQKRELAKAITNAFVEIYQVPAAAVTIVIREVPRTNFASGGVLKSDQ